MALPKPEKRVAVSAAKLLVKSMISVIVYVGSAVCAQAQEAQPNTTNESWTATTETSGANTKASRTMESHTKSGDRSVDKQRVEVPGPNGGYQPYSETEKETIQVNATTTRTVERSYRWDVNGQRYLVQVTGEVAQSSASGDAQLVRTTSSSDANGNLQVTQREVANTRKTSPNAQETKTTLYILDGNGRLTPFLQTQELRKRSDDHTVEVKTVTLGQDSSGIWKVSEVKESTIKEDGKNRTSEESVSRSDLNGRLSEVSRTVDKETETAAGEKNKTIETYSENIPGLAPDGSLHLTWRVTTVQRKDSGGKTTEQQVEQPKSGDPNAGLQVGIKTKYVVQYGASGTQQTKTTQERDINGTSNVVFVETRKSDQGPAAQAQATPSEKPK
ncbi:MAG TPA: hypothetical protein VFN26_17915 [Candidatus Acidoferrum sp.]|nr:hypothetical protein [Candidatus Acidoferrum sp.]